MGDQGKTFFVRDGERLKAIYPLTGSKDCVTCEKYDPDMDGCPLDVCPGYRRAGNVVITISGPYDLSRARKS